MKKGKVKFLVALLVVLLAGLYYYIALPAINIHATELWVFLLLVVAAVGIAYAGRKKYDRYEMKESKVIKGLTGVFVLLVAAYIIGSLLSSPIINAKKYQALLEV